MGLVVDIQAEENQEHKLDNKDESAALISLQKETSTALMPLKKEGEILLPQSSFEKEEEKTILRKIDQFLQEQKRTNEWLEKRKYR